MEIKDYVKQFRDLQKSHKKVRVRILNVSLFVKMQLTDLLTKAGIAEIEDKRYVQLQLEFKD